MQAIFRRFYVLEMFGNEIDKFFVIEVAGGADDKISGGEVVAVETRDHGTVEFLDRFPGSQNRQAKRVIFPETLGEDFVDQIVGIVLIHFYFFEDDAALARDIASIEYRMEDEIGENIHRDRQMLIENFDVEADAFLGRERIHVAPDRVDLAGDGFGRTGLGAFKDHVLDEMRDAIPFGVFVARAGLEPDADRDGAKVGHLLSDDGEAIRQGLTTNAAGFFYHLKFVSQV